MPIIHEVSDCVIFMRGNTTKLYLNMSLQHWTKVGSGKKKPHARYLHTACCIAGPLTGQDHPLLLVVGGDAGGWDVLSDVWLLDVDKGVWSEVGMLYLIVLPVIYKHADSYSNLSAPIGTHSAGNGGIHVLYL